MSRYKLTLSERYLPATSSPLLNKSGSFRHNLVTAPDMMPCTGQCCCVEKGLWRDVVATKQRLTSASAAAIAQLNLEGKGEIERGEKK